MSANGTLQYIGVARKNIDGHDGLRYMCTWATGWEVLILADEDHATKFGTDRKLKVIHKNQRTQKDIDRLDQLAIQKNTGPKTRSQRRAAYDAELKND